MNANVNKDRSMKTCSRCGLHKAIEEFKRDRDRIGGFRGTCKKCVKEREQIVSRLRRHPQIVGPMPKAGETSIYYLRRPPDNIGFYVGQTTNPQIRIRQQLNRFGDEIQLVVIKNVPDEDSTYWECKTIVDFIEAGCPLVNKMAGASR